MYTNPRRINRNAKLGQIEVMQVFVAQSVSHVALGDAERAGEYAAKAWHAMRLAGTAANRTR